MHVGIHVPVTVKPTVATATTTTTTVPVSEPAENGNTETPTTTTTTKLYNRTILITPSGTLDASATYDKLHLFDYGTLRESASTQAGASLTAPFASPVGRVGSLICFDLRFPEPALALARPGADSPFYGNPAQVLLFPSAFTVPTGRAHWEVLCGLIVLFFFLFASLSCFSFLARGDRTAGPPLPPTKKASRFEFPVADVDADSNNRSACPCHRDGRLGDSCRASRAAPWCGWEASGMYQLPTPEVNPRCPSFSKPPFPLIFLIVT